MAVFFALTLLANAALLCSGSPLVPYSEPVAIARGLRAPETYRLPATTVPTRYDITLVVDPNAARFRGEASLRIRAVTNATSVVVHLNGLNVTATRLNDTASGAAVPIRNGTYPTDDDFFYTIELIGTALVPGREYDLAFEYDAPFSSALNGLYKSSYLMANGTRRYVAATQFQPTHARKVFPCYDEPALKAVFNIHIYVPTGYSALCNMDTIPSNLPPMEGYVATSFRSTPLMSTYLVALVVSDFGYKSNLEDGEVLYLKEYRVHARPTTRDTLDYPLDIGQRSLQYMQAYTDLTYRLPKVDNVALADFGAGAMENWGLITYREEYMLYYEGISTSNSKMIIATIMAHENAHFWFGNEVSPLWWDYTWLNEGFATFFEFYATNKVYNGEWRLMEQFAVNEMQNVMVQDSLPTTNAMSATVGSPEEIQVNFNSIAYSKSGAVIRMFSHAFTDALFRLSLSTYLKNLPTGVSEPQTLYREMQKVMGNTTRLPRNATVSDVFGSWSEQPGYPIIAITKPTSESIRLSQTRFYQNNTLNSNQSWWIPVSWATSRSHDFENTTNQFWLGKDLSNVLTLNVTGLDWYILNKQFTGYYRVMYDEANWKNLANLLRSEEHAVLHPLNKAQLIDDSAMFSRTNRLSYNITFDILNYLSNETDWIPWTSANRVLSYLNTRMVASNQYPLYRGFVQYKSSRVFESVTFYVNENDGYVTRRKRNLVNRIACDSGLKRCLQEAEDVLKDSLQTTKPLNPDIKSVVYCSAVRSGEEALWNGAFDRYANTSSESEKSFIINGLGCAENGIILDSYLNMTLVNTSRLRAGDRVSAIRSAINAGPFGIGRVLTFLMDHFIALKENIGSADSIIQNLGNVIAADVHINLFNNFTQKYDANFTTSERRAAETAKTTIGGVVEWRANYLKEIDTWLELNVNISSGGKLQSSIILTILFSIYVFFKN